MDFLNNHPHIQESILVVAINEWWFKTPGPSSLVWLLTSKVTLVILSTSVVPN